MRGREQKSEIGGQRSEVGCRKLGGFVERPADVMAYRSRSRPNPTGFCGPSETWVYNPRRGRRRETQARRADIIVARRTKSIFEPRRGDITKSPDPEDAAAKPKPDPATTQPDRVLCSLRGVGFNRCRGCPEGVA